MKRIETRTIAGIGVLSSLAAGLMFLETALPYAPGFLKLDVSELPVLLGTFAFGPLAGILIELVKNLVHLSFGSMSFGIGELANFVIGSAFLVPAGLIYKMKKDRLHALIGLAIGTVSMILVAVAFNYFFLLPAYAKFMRFPLDEVIKESQKAVPAIKNLLTFILYGIVPFNLFKGIVISILTLLVYKRVSPLLHKNR